MSAAAHGGPPTVEALPDRPKDRSVGFRPPVQVAPGLYRLRVPQPGFAANHLYLLTGRVPTLIDSGHPHAGCQRHLDRGLDALGLGRADLAQVLYTHTHMDHMGGGMTSWEGRELAHVEHRAWSRVSEDAVDRTYGRYTHRLHDWTGWLEGLPPDARIEEWLTARRAGGHKVEWLTLSEQAGRPLSPRGLRPGVEVEAGDLRLRVLDVRGHDPYHLAFAHPDGDWIVTGDTVLATPTPLVPAMDDDAEDYRRSLDRIAELGAARVLPAHGPVWDDGPAAVARSIRDFDRFSTGVLGALRALGRASPTAVLFALMDVVPAMRHLKKDLLGALLGNVHSHLRRLERRGRVREVEPAVYEVGATP